MNAMELFALRNVAKTLGSPVLRTKSKLIGEMRKHMDREELACFWEESRGGFVPDSWSYSPENERGFSKIIAIEIEDTSKLTIEKIRKYIAFWWCCDANFIDLELRVYDRYGIDFKKINLFDAAYSELESDAAEMGGDQ